MKGETADRESKGLTGLLVVNTGDGFIPQRVVVVDVDVLIK